ncbi:hypothetical protein B0H63DRAFT_95050 [Podospora didyma]|uniref:Uncharacterized protein n=1 Tax=Podospora didyma TaxID=330526 RepID=A0AAE0NX32_9PEZI|nr:hypothetical protein B0H63DRAFT_95050 [Podospora didyma]
MPYPSIPVLFSIHRDSAYSWPQPNKPKKSPRNKLKKRPPCLFSERNIATHDLSQLMGNNVSFENIPRPARPPRPSATDIPELPSLPMYENFTSKHHHPVTVLDEKPRCRENFSSKRDTNWSSPSGPRVRWVDERPSTTVSVVSDTSTIELPAPPRYDRSSRLAESYRALLPDVNAIEYKETRHALRRQHSVWRLHDHQQHMQLQDHRHSTHHRSQHSSRPPLSHNNSCNSAVRTPEHDIRHTRARTSRPTEPSTPASSITAVDSDSQSPIDEWSSNSEGYSPQKTTFLAPSKSSCPSATLSESRSELILRGSDQRTVTSSDYVGLQICSELLTEELTKTLFRQHPADETRSPRASKLQVLLLIEAYEAMLETCRREMLKPPPVRVSASERRRHLKDAVRILDHWLDSLYVIYDEAFGDGDGEAGGGGGGVGLGAGEGEEAEDMI